MGWQIGKNVLVREVDGAGAGTLKKSTQLSPKLRFGRHGGAIKFAHHDEQGKRARASKNGDIPELVI